MTPKVDKLDMRILEELQHDARQSYREIAKRLNIAEGTVYNRVNKLREMGVIKSFVPDIDYTKLGLDMQVFIGVIIDGPLWTNIGKTLEKIPEVDEIYNITGEYDLMLKARLRDTKELGDLARKILQIKGVKKTYTMTVLETLRDRKFTFLGNN